MPWRDALAPVRMARVALVAPEASLRAMLVAVAAEAAVELDEPTMAQNTPGETPGHQPDRAAPAALAGIPPVPALSAEPPDFGAADPAGRYDLLAGETELRAHARAVVAGSGAVALAGWMEAGRVGGLAARLAGLGCSVVPLPHPPGADAPTLLGGSPAHRALTPLVSTYGTVPYADLDPTWLVWASYVLMFGVMFGDAGHGLLLLAAALCLRAGWPRWARKYRAAWLFVGGAGLAAIVFGAAYGEFFGPTGVIGAFWLAPLARPIPLLAAAIGAGAFLLACAYALGTVNRWRESGWRLALYAASGIAGSAVFLGLGLAAGGWYLHQTGLLIAGGAVAITGLALAAGGFAAEAGGGGVGVMQVLVELFDLVVRLGSNVVSFARLAAFGLTHAAIGLLVWEGSRALWQRGGVQAVLAVVLFLAGNAVAFGLEVLVAAIQALRLEYYELFSRVFVTQGRRFRPWALKVVTGRNLPVLRGGGALGEEGV